MRKIAHRTTMKKDSFPGLSRLLGLTIAFMLLGYMQLAAKGVAEEYVTLNLKSVELRKALMAIEKKTEYRFLFNEALLSNKPKVDIHVVETPVTTVLDQILENTGISYKVLQNKLVVLKGSAESAISDLKDVTVNGRVTNTDGEGVPGVSVSVKGTRIGTTTDAAGNYTITVPDDGVLVFSSVGYETQEVTVGGRTSINVILVQTATTVEEVVVIGYGTAAKRDLTGSIVKISGEEVQDKPNVNPVSSLQGKVAGLSVVNVSTPGASPDIRIRGTVSTGSARPLYVVDGILNDNIDYLNPNDIESIEILKDPSSLAIFGVRGAAGVIAVTTKRAKAGQLVVNLNSSFGVKKLVDKIDMVNAEEFKMLFIEEQQNIGLQPSEMFDFSNWTGNTDWVDEMTQTGTFNNNNLSVSSSTEKNKFYLGLGYINEEGIVKREQLKKILLSFNDELKISKAFKVGVNFNGFRQRLPYSSAQGLLFDARRIWPVTPVYNEANGEYYDLAFQSAQMINPKMVLENNWDKERRFERRLVGSVFGEVSFLKNFSFRSTFYGDMSNLDGRTYRPIINVYNPALDTTFAHSSFRSTRVNQSEERWNKFQQDHILTFKNRFGEHNLNATAGFTTYYSEYRGTFASGAQSITGLPIPNDERFWYVDNGFVDDASRRGSSGQSESAQVSGLIRALYNFRNTYYLNASFRRDASSQISPLNREKNFYSIGAAWEVSRENFMQSQNLFNYLKLKGSWGSLGNYNTFGLAYPYYPELQTGSTAVFGNVIAPAYGLAYEPNRELTWESVDAKEVGLEWGMLNNKLTGEFAYYNKLTKDLLAFIDLGPAGTRLDNIGEILNRGFELSSTWSNNISKDFSYSISGNFTTYHNEVKSLPSGAKLNASEERPNQTEEGFPIGYFYGYVAEGIYQSYADKLASVPMNLGNNYGPGDLKYKDINGDGVVDSDDRTIIGNPTPDFTYGAALNLNYKGFDLGIDVNGV
ncbi:MAG TPA: SusC/RagA family TonB-linked outer membrane protein, partial [Chitinophagaceae bacterium]